MAILFLDPIGGNDANDGLSFANRVATFAGGITAARTAPGDTIRIMRSPQPTLVAAASKWTNAPTPAAVGTMTAATNATPIVVTKAAHGLATGDIVRITGAAGNTAANGVREVTLDGADPTNKFALNGSVGNGVWTSGGSIQLINNRVVRIPAVLVKNVDDGEAIWTAANTATTALQATAFTEFLNAAQITLPASPATSTLYGYKALGAVTDFSAFQQLTFNIQVGAVTLAGHLKICLCSDTAGATIVDTFLVPAIGSAVRNIKITVDKGSALGASIQSVALYSDTVAPPASLVVRLDNIMACKASSSADSVSLTSLLGKVNARRQNIVSSTNATPIVLQATAHGLEDNDFVYIVDHATNTAANGVWKVLTTDANNYRLLDPVTGENSVGNGTGGATGSFVSQETWWGIDNITVNAATTICMLATNGNADGFNSRGYAGSTRTCDLYKRETVKRTMVTSGVAVETVQEGGTDGLLMIYSGGWNPTDMSTQDGDTIWDPQSGLGILISISTTRNFLAFDRLHGTRCGIVMGISPVCYGWQVGYLTGFNTASTIWSAINSVFTRSTVKFLVLNGSAGSAFNANANYDSTYIFICACSNTSIGVASLGAYATIETGIFRNNLTAAMGSGGVDTRLLSGITENNGVAFQLTTDSGVWRTMRLVSNEATDVTFSGAAFGRQGVAYCRKDDTDLHGFDRLYHNVRSETSVRQTASGYAWRINVTSSNATQNTPVLWKIATVPCNANQVVTVKAWVRRTNTGLSMQMFCPAHQIKGVNAEVSASITAAIDTWEELTITFTPTEDNMVEIYLRMWGGTTFSGYVDNMTITVGGTAIDLPTMDWQLLGEPFVTYKPPASGGAGIGVLVGRGLVR